MSWVYGYMALMGVSVMVAYIISLYAISVTIMGAAEDVPAVSGLKHINGKLSLRSQAGPMIMGVAQTKDNKPASPECGIQGWMHGAVMVGGSDQESLVLLRPPGNGYHLISRPGIGALEWESAPNLKSFNRDNLEFTSGFLTTTRPEEVRGFAWARGISARDPVATVMFTYQSRTTQITQFRIDGKAVLSETLFLPEQWSLVDPQPLELQATHVVTAVVVREDGRYPIMLATGAVTVDPVQKTMTLRVETETAVGNSNLVQVHVVAQVRVSSVAPTALRKDKWIISAT